MPEPKKLPPARVVRAIEKLRNGLARVRRKSFPPAVSALELVTGYWVAQAVITATRLGIAEELKAGPKPTAELAAALGLHEPSLFRLLRSLAAADVFVEGPARTFSHTAISRTLLKDAPDSVRGMVLMQGEEWHWRTYEKMETSIRTGTPAFERVHGMQLFEYLEKNPSSGELFNEAMTGWVGQSAAAVVDAYDFSHFGTVADIGAGHGHLLATLLDANPRVRGLHYDLPHVAEGARSRYRERGLEARCEIRSGSFFETVPLGADAYILKNILHDWDDASCLKILGNCRKVVPRGEGRLLIVESVIPPGNAAHIGKLIDLEMLVCTHGGLERSAREFRALLSQAGFTLTDIHQTSAVESVLEAS